MNINYYTKYGKGFQLLCELQPSDRYKQGIELKDVRLLKDNRELYSQPGVYILANTKGEVLKIGQTSNMFNRIYTQYKCVSNATNHRIRDYIKSVESVLVYVFMLPKKKTRIPLGLNRYTVYTSFAGGFEHALLKEFKDTTKALPKLNTMIR
jgi:virulence-associated protein VapD